MWLKKRPALIAGLLVVLVFVAGVTFYCTQQYGYEPVYTIPRQVKYSFTIQNKTNRLIKKADFLAYAPVYKTSSQSCEKLTVSHPHEVLVDDLGNQIIKVTFEAFPPFSTQIVTVKADMLLSEQPNSLREPDTSSYLSSQVYVESDNKEIITIAEQLKQRKEINTAESIHNWVADHIEYSGYISRPRGALYALNNKKGDCTEYMYLFAALCRANTIPARGVGGYICTNNTILKPARYHNWAEFYGNKTWQIADPQNKRFMTNASDYIAMKIEGSETKQSLPSFHRFYVGNSNLTVKMN